jgi:hypothetical protein
MIDIISESNELTFAFYIVVGMVVIALMGAAEWVWNKLKR